MANSGISEGESIQVVLHFIQKLREDLEEFDALQGTAEQLDPALDTEDFRKLHEELREIGKHLDRTGWIQEVSDKRKHHPEPQGDWSTKERPRARRAEIGEATVSTEVKTLPEVREYTKALATAQGLHTQELIEHLMVTAINTNPKLVEKGTQYLERFNGNIAAARRFALTQKPSHTEALEATTSSRLR